MDKIIELKNIFKSYTLGETKIDALQGLDLTLFSGEFTALIGASGSGKSTLLNLIGHLDEVDSGEIKLEGKSTKHLNEDEKSHIRNRRLGYIFQNFNLIPVLTVYENIELPLSLWPELTNSDKKSKIMQALKDVDLENFINYYPDKLSGGQRQRVAIARALVTNPALILADEPTANLDSKTTHNIIDLMQDLNKNKKVTFLFCTHDEKLIDRVNRVVRIQDGKILSDTQKQ